MKKSIGLFLLVCFFASCKIEGNFKGLYSYYKQTKSENPRLLVDVDPATSVCNIVPTKEPRIYLVTGIELKKCIKSDRDAVVYIWNPNCSGKLCYSLKVMEEQCKAMNKDLFIVAKYYDNTQMSLNQNIGLPIFGIDTRYYKTDKTAKYLRQFLHDLTRQEKITGNIIYFKNGAYFRSGYGLDMFK